MTDPERLSLRSTGLAAELLRAAAEEQPRAVGMQQTLIALGVSGVVLSSTSAAAVGGAKLTSAASASAASASAASASAGGVGLATASGIKPLSLALVVKWLGIGLVGGLSLASAAAVATAPSAPARSPSPTAKPAPALRRAVAAQSEPRATVVDAPAPEAAVSAARVAPRVVAVESRAAEPTLEAGSPLATEVAYVDRARALLAAGQSSQGLALLEHYEQKFREARLLPEVLFLQLEAYQRAGRSAEARNAAQRLVDGFPKSPHAGRARKLLEH